MAEGRATSPWCAAAAACRGVFVGVACALLVGAALARSDAGGAYRHADAPQRTTLIASFGAASPAPDARHLADWIARTRDNLGKPFFLIDKVNATLFVFDRQARLQASTPVLLGAAVGDDSVPGIGTRPMAQILPGERTTPAGRFTAEVGLNLQGEDVVWVDHDAAVSIHRVRTYNARERRTERLRTPTAGDNRISYGCINVPVAFYNQHVQAAFAANRTAVVYVLPETRSIQAQFGLQMSPHQTARSSP